MSKIKLEEVEKRYPEVKWGGFYSPPNCSAWHKVAIIVPYRDRKRTLPTFLNHMHPFLMKQQLEYQIFIVEQEGDGDFNRGKILNVGFVESQKLKADGWECFVFHDIDMLPLDTRNMYSCPDPLHPRLTLVTDSDFGGVAYLTREQFVRANGYSNGYWAWAGEDNDLFRRLTDLDYKVDMYHYPIVRYASLQHLQKAPSPLRYDILMRTTKSFQNDGLSKLEYTVSSVTAHRLYTHISVNVDHTYHEIQDLLREHERIANLPRLKHKMPIKEYY